MKIQQYHTSNRGSDCFTFRRSQSDWVRRQRKGVKKAFYFKLDLIQSFAFFAVANKFSHGSLVFQINPIGNNFAITNNDIGSVSAIFNG